MHVIGFGEILWDMLPEGKQLGGAPANVVFHSLFLGADSYMVSAVGMDDKGREMMQLLENSGFPIDYIQVLKDYPTGTVDVKLDASGKPDYVIHENVAWDHIGLTEEVKKLSAKADAVCFGSLAQRSRETRETIQHLLEIVPDKCLRVFDVNLRQSFYNKTIIQKSLERCDVLKLNDDELPVIGGYFGYESGEENIISGLLHHFNLSLIALTKGDQGSRLVSHEEESYLDSPDIDVVDTVGAGDAFTAALINGLLTKKPLKKIHSSASKLASFVCTQEGATPKIPSALLNEIEA